MFIFYIYILILLVKKSLLNANKRSKKFLSSFSIFNNTLKRNKNEVSFNKAPIKETNTESNNNFCKVYEEEEEVEDIDIIDNQVIKMNENKEITIYAINYSSIESLIGWEFFAEGQGVGVIKDVFLQVNNKNGKQEMIGCVQYTDGRLNTITIDKKITFINKIV